jgi:NOL1/NOP2/fmu family ribosome biogenesis protein
MAMVTIEAANLVEFELDLWSAIVEAKIALEYRINARGGLYVAVWHRRTLSEEVASILQRDSNSLN